MPSRRQVLKTGAAIGVGSMIGLAGCLGGGDGGDFESWLVDPFALSGRPDQYFVTSVSPAGIDEYANELPREEWDDIRDSFVDGYAFTRFLPDEIDRVTTGAGGYEFGGFDVIVGEVDPEEVGDDLERADLRSRGEYEGFELYEHDEEAWAAAVADGTLVLAGDPEDENPVFVVEDIVDASEGEERTYSEVDDDFEALMDAAPVGETFFAVTQEPVEETAPEQGQFRNQVGTAVSTEFGEDDSDFDLVLLFEDERDPRERDVEDWTREDDSFRLLRDIEIEIDEEVVHVHGEVPTRDVFEVGIL